MTPTDIRKVVTVEADSYFWRPGSHVKAAPDKAVDEFRGIYKRDGAVTASALVEAARPEGSVFHEDFEWNTDEAARLYNEQQARYLMRSLVVIYKKPDGTKTEPVRALIKIVPSADDETLEESVADAMEPHVYLPVRTVVDEEALRRRWKLQALNALISWRRQYKDITEFARIFEEIDVLATQEQRHA